jgi:hypothetical protein
MTAEADDYSPDQIRYWLAHWRELQVAAEGGTGSLNGGGGGQRKRLDVACLLADLERAADQLPLQWSATLEVFRSQGRQRVWAQRRLGLEDTSLEVAIQAMARSLGWAPH